MERNSELHSQHVALLYLLLCLVPEIKYKGTIYLRKLLEGIPSIMVGKERPTPWWSELVPGWNTSPARTSKSRTQRPDKKWAQIINRKAWIPGIYFLSLRLHLSKVPQPTQTATPAGDQVSECVCLQGRFHIRSLTAVILQLCGHTQGRKGLSYRKWCFCEPRPGSRAQRDHTRTLPLLSKGHSVTHRDFHLLLPSAPCVRSRGLASGKVLWLSQPSQWK